MDKKGPIQPSDIENAITNRTKIVSISAVQYLDGQLSDLKAIGEICKKYDLFFVVDGIQGLGAVNINKTECHIDALVDVLFASKRI